ncbi:hypothetical protein Rsub_08162 [Raphidocelis subcapitata]|uniref:RING-type E3 ubiquitin transferase n=1 Tax=Raphidocelis subcapitata TaxID=307507 RepID=A0A2V0P5S0_9CHLO|nr:hypothetical protein Rsub_08162 [Raphidocelis subcapitata]|eukprot:GBF94919.1 hypothetical protein Rsub_08162 [Raphidocelis subcapitata]
MANEGCVSYAGIACSAIGALFYAISRSQDAQAQHISSARALGRLDEALSLEHVLPLLVALRGRADAASPKQCELSDARAVVHELVEEDILVTRSAAGHAVRNPFETRRELTTTDWFLEDGSGQRVRVESARTARVRHDALEMRQDYRERADGPALQSIAQFFTGNRTQGYKRKESYIPVGAILTVVGELSRNALAGTGGGARYVVRPPPGGDYVITSQAVQQLRAGFVRASMVYKSIAVAFGGLGAYLIARKALRRWLRARRERAARKLLQQAAAKARERRAALHAAAAEEGGAAAAAGAAAPSAAAMAAGGDDRELDTCVVCLEHQACIVFTGCGHLCVCQGCSKPLKKCPVCRAASPMCRVFRM